MTSRPACIVISMVLLWIYGLGVLAFQVVFSIPRVGIIDFFGIAVGSIALLGAILLTVPIRKSTSWIIALAALAVIAVRGFLTTKTQFSFRDEFPHIMSSVVASLCLSLAITALAFWMYRTAYWFAPESKPQSPSEDSHR